MPDQGVYRFKKFFKAPMSFHMYLQGQLQTVFDALYEMGIIEPVLKMDWQTAYKQMEQETGKLEHIVHVVNTHNNDVEELITRLEQFDEKLLSYLAMEVAREFADFHACSQIH
jgi:hypothetical protein